MYHSKQENFDWRFALAAGDAVMLLASLGVTALFYDPAFGFIDKFEERWLGDMAVYLFLAYLALRNSSLYTWSTLNASLLLPLRLLWMLLWPALGFAALVVLMNVERPLLLRWLLLETANALIFLWGGRLLLRFCIRDVFKLVPGERIAFVGWSPKMQKVLTGLRKEIGRFHELIGFFEAPDNPAANPPTDGVVRRLGSLSGLEEVNLRERLTRLIVDEVAMRPETLQELAATCSRLVLTIGVIPSAFDTLTTRLATRMIAGVPVMGIQGLPLDFFLNRLLKRLVDIVGAVVGLVLSGPVILLCVGLIKRESPGPAFFRQVRLGLDGRPFQIIKLRSMRLDAEKNTGAVWAVENDPRRLRIGAILRKTNLDETPQFWNVLKGEMSLVGPRPERPELVQSFSHNLRHYNLRQNAKPGITSWAAVHGLRGNTSLRDRLDYDIYYFENWSLLLDFQIMLMTLLPPKNAY